MDDLVQIQVGQFVLGLGLTSTFPPRIGGAHTEEARSFMTRPTNPKMSRYPPQIISVQTKGIDSMKKRDVSPAIRMYQPDARYSGR